MISEIVPVRSNSCLIYFVEYDRSTQEYHIVKIDPNHNESIEKPLVERVYTTSAKILYL